MMIVLAWPMRVTASAAIRSFSCVECSALIRWWVSKDPESTARIVP
ncbi:hypothetical protein [Actinomyces sp. W5033]